MTLPRVHSGQSRRVRPTSPVPRGGAIRAAARRGAAAITAAVEPLEGRRLLSVSLVKDVFAGPAGSGPEGWADVGGAHLFMATDWDHGQEVWRTDGTAAGTQLVKDVNPDLTAFSIALRPVDGKAIFLTSVPGGLRLYGTDGTDAGTVPLSSEIGFQGDQKSAGDFVYLATNHQLWWTDGTPAGTFPVADTSLNVFGESQGYAQSGSKLYFMGADQEPWVSDGTLAGTHQLADPYPDRGTGAYGFAVAGDGSVYFLTGGSTGGPELWRTDGTAAGTTFLKAITPPAGNSDTTYLFRAGPDRIAFNFDGALWGTDGTPTGTVQIKSTFVPQSLDVAGPDALYFSENGALWRSDGTAVGTRTVPGTPTGVMQIQRSGPTLYFAGTDAAGGQELWGATDGAAARIKDVAPGAAGSGVLLDGPLDGRMYFRADDGTGPQLWESDGTEAGTYPITIGGPGTVGQTASVLGRAADGTEFLRADDGTVGSELWATKPDAPSVFSITDVTASEGNAGTTPFTFVVSRPSGAGYASVHWATANGTTAGQSATAGSDYVAAAGAVTFAPGELSKTITVNVVGDAAVEADEKFSVNLTDGYFATFADAQGVGTIVNDDSATPGLSVNDVSTAEGNSGTKNLTFTVTLNKKVAKAVTFSYATASGTATGGTDFVAKTGTGTIAANALSTTVTVAVKGDATYEPDETFALKLSNAKNAAILDAAGVGKIVNDDAKPAIRIYDAPSIIEGNSGFRQLVYTVKLDRASSTAVTVDFATADGTAKLALNDYKAASGKLTFNPGETSKTIVVTTVGDTRKGVNETVFVNLGGPVGATIADGQGVGTILNDD